MTTKIPRPCRHGGCMTLTTEALGDLEDDYLEHAEICMRRSDYLALVDTLANGNASLYAAPPEAILGIPAFFCDKAVKPDPNIFPSEYPTRNFRDHTFFCQL